MTNQPPDPNVIQRFKQRRKRQIIATIPFIIGLILLIVGSERGGFSPAIVGPVFLTYVIGMLIFSFKNWRCPGCNRYLGKGMSPRFCQKCGIQLQE